VDLATAPNTIGWIKTDKTLFLINPDNQVSGNHDLWMNQHTNMGLWIYEDTTVI
jgi:hypothetical protein